MYLMRLPVKKQVGSEAVALAQFHYNSTEHQGSSTRAVRQWQQQHINILTERKPQVLWWQQRCIVGYMYGDLMSQFSGKLAGSTHQIPSVSSSKGRPVQDTASIEIMSSIGASQQMFQDQSETETVTHWTSRLNWQHNTYDKRLRPEDLRKKRQRCWPRSF